MEGLIEGKIVHAIIPELEGTGTKERPAIVVQVWSQENGSCNLQAFTDGLNDKPSSPYDKGIVSDGANVMWLTSYVYSEGQEPCTWHWIR